MNMQGKGLKLNAHQERFIFIHLNLLDERHEFKVNKFRFVFVSHVVKELIFER